jgi:hypothetical protein
MHRSVIRVDFTGKRVLDQATADAPATEAARDPLALSPLATGALLHQLRSGYARMSASSRGMHSGSAELAHLSARLHEDLRSLLTDAALMARAMPTKPPASRHSVADPEFDVLGL